MTVNGWLQIGLYALVILAITRPLGLYMFRVFEGDRQPFPRILGPVERLLYRLSGVNPERDQTWWQYAAAMLLFSLFTMVVTYGIERLQHVLPWNPQHIGPVEPMLAFNTAASFTTNTNWQNYGGESTMSYLTQMSGLAVQNFVSAAVGMAVAIAMIRGFTRSRTDKLGNFWVDLTRAVIRLLLPLAVI